jgi:hypothetical protein
MAIKIEFTLAGLPDVMAHLDNLTPELVNEVEKMQRDIAETAAATIRGLYVAKTGELARGIQTRRLLKGRVVAATVVENTVWWASIYEHGSKTKRETKQGYNRGQMPARPIFWRTMNAAKREANARTVEILRRHGLTVISHAA